MPIEADEPVSIVFTIAYGKNVFRWEEGPFESSTSLSVLLDPPPEAWMVPGMADRPSYVSARVRKPSGVVMTPGVGIVLGGLPSPAEHAIWRSGGQARGPRALPVSMRPTDTDPTRFYNPHRQVVRWDPDLHHIEPRRARIPSADEEDPWVPPGQDLDLGPLVPIQAREGLEVAP